MSWSSVSPPSSRLLFIFAALVTTALASSSVHGQNKPKRKQADDKNAPVTALAEQISGRADRKIALSCDVEVMRGQTRVYADQALYDTVEDEIDASGHVLIRRFGDTYTGTHLLLNLDSGKGTVTEPEYKIELNNAQGKASRVEFESEDQATIYNGTYSTCEGPNPDWYLRANTLKLDMGRDVGTATGTTVYFKGVPIIPGAPAMSFPISSARKSGWLPPTIGATSKGGVEFALPYYFNIAPNRDLTLVPKVITKRGLQMAADGRYLGATYFGETNIEFLPNDQQTGTNRYALASKHSQWLLPAWTFGWNLNTASDNYYPGDFSNSVTNSAQRQLVRELRTDYNASFWTVSARMQNYQVLQDPGAVLDPTLNVPRPYDRLPQINLHAGRYDVHGFDWSFDSELTRFWHPDLVRGTRLVVNPQISYPITTPGYFVTPKLSFNASTYQLENPAVGQPTTLHRALPTFSVDSGVVFERDSHFFGQAVTQTLEPRLFYVYTPYRDQTQFPNFDSAQASFNFAQIFSENRFVGNDRISDSNQVTAALVSRYIESNGAERLRLAIGQRFYFTPQRVELDAAQPTTNESHSDLLLSASGRISKNWGVDSAIQYSESAHRVYSSNYSVQWQPAPKQVVNAEYRYLSDSFKQLNLSVQWPLASRWYAVGRISRSLPDHKTVDSLIGAEYNADCWVLRLVGQRYATTTLSSTSSLFIQLELNGLSRLGSNPLEALSKSIPGYQKVNQR